MTLEERLDIVKPPLIHPKLPHNHSLGINRANLQVISLQESTNFLNLLFLEVPHHMLMNVLEGDASIGALLGLFQANFSQASWLALKVDIFLDIFDLEH